MALCLALAAAGAEPSREEELAHVRQRIAELQGVATSLEVERQGLAADLVRLEVDLDLRTERLAEARLAHRGALERVLELAAELGEIEERLRVRRMALVDRLTQLYRLDRQGGLKLLLSDRERTDVQPGMRVLRYLARTDSRAVEEYLEDHRTLEARRRELHLQELEADLWVRTEREALFELQELRQSKQRLVSDLRRRETTARIAARDLAQRESRLARFLDALVGSVRLDGEPIQDFEGILDRPVLGSVVQGFGPRLDPRYRTRVPHNGLEFVTLAGAEVQTVYPGKVLYAADLEGYGPTAIVLHPGRVFSLYAGLARLDVGVDDVLSLGAAVGASSGRIYFEIRVENRPVDPAGWLR